MDECLKELEIFTQSLNFSPRFALRIDKVGARDHNLEWLLSFIGQYDLRASLECMPSSLLFSEEWMERCDPERRLEVSQHGYCTESLALAQPSKLPERNSDSTLRLQCEMRSAMEILSELFPNRFKKGYSNSLDALPDWLPAFWGSIGGKYITTIENHTSLGHLPSVRGLTPIWEGKDKYLRSWSSITAALARNMTVRGYAGLVVQPDYFEDLETRARFKKLVEALLGECKWQPLSSLAALPAERTIVTSSRRYRHISYADSTGTVNGPF